MAANNAVNEFVNSHGCLSSVSSEQSEISLAEYSGDFLSSSSSSVSETERKTSLSLGEVVVGNGVCDGEELAKFLQKKLHILKENRVLEITKATKINQTLLSSEKYEKLSPFWFKKLQILREKTEDSPKKTTFCKEVFPRNGREKANVEISCVEKDILGEKVHSKRSLENCVQNKRSELDNEKGYFQTAFERMRFENLQFKCRKFIESDLHSPRTCDECKKKKQTLYEAKFYKRSIQTVHRKDIEQNVEKHIHKMSSPLLIAKIIEAGPQPSWNSEELWEKILSGGYQHMNTIIL